MERNMVAVCRSGQTPRATRGCGRTIKPTDKVSWCTLMATSMRVCGSTTKPMAMELTGMQTGQRTWATGSKTNSMAKVSRLGLMVRGMMAATRMGRKMARGRLPSLTGRSTRAHSFRMRSVVRGATSGPMASSTRANGRRIRCMGAACSSGPTGSSTRATS